MLVASLVETLVIKPIFNLLVLIYGILPGHNFGLSLIIFTIVVRLLMWPLVKKQLHQAKAMRELQPEIKRIKKATKGNRQQESLMMMELYKEREISPFGSIGTLVIQLVILISLYAGLRRVVDNPHAVLDYAYSWLRDLPWLKSLAADIGRFDATLFGVVDLKRAAIGKSGFYAPAFAIVIGSAIAQYYQSKQLMPSGKDSRKLRDILRDANKGKQADQSEVNAAVGRSTRFLLPVFIVYVTIQIASALSLYWLVSGIVAYIQQARVLGKDEQEMEAVADKADSNEPIEGEVIEPPKKPKAKKKTSKTTKKRRK